MKKLLVIIMFTTLEILNTKAQIISTFAGNNPFGAGYNGDGGQATDAELNYPVDVKFDRSGNLYIADRSNNVVRKINTLGIISTIAGNGMAGYSGDGGPATAAEFNDDVGVLIDSIGNIYISDFGNSVIRKVNTAGIIYTIAGNHIFGYSGDTGPATASELSTPGFMAIDSSGNLLFSDGWNDVIRKVDNSGIITTIAGNHLSGYSGDGGPATAAEFGGTEGVAIDGNGNIYIPDTGNNVIRKVNNSGIITTIVGNGVQGYNGDGGQATAAELNAPAGVTIDKYGNIYIADENNNVIRMVNSSGIIKTIVGNAIQSYSGDGGPATAAELNEVSALAFNNSGNMFLADEYNNVIREVAGITTIINQISNTNCEISVHPNPNNGIFTIQPFVVNSPSSIEIYTILGNKIYTASLPQTPEGALNEINISNQPSGIYILSFHLANQTFYKKLIITN